MRMIVSIHRISEICFFALGVLYGLAFLLWRNEVFPFFSEIFLQLADLPLALFSLLFGLTSIRLSFFGQPSPENKGIFGDMVTLFLALALFFSVVVVDLVFENQLPFPHIS